MGRPRALGVDQKLLTVTITAAGYARLEAEMATLGLPTMSDTVRRVLREGLEALGRKREWERRQARKAEKASKGGLSGVDPGSTMAGQEESDAEAATES